MTDHDRRNIPVVVATLYRPEAKVPGLVAETAVPKTAAPAGCSGVAALAVVGFVAFAALALVGCRGKPSAADLYYRAANASRDSVAWLRALEDSAGKAAAPLIFAAARFIEARHRSPRTRADFIAGGVDSSLMTSGADDAVIYHGAVRPPAGDDGRPGDPIIVTASLDEPGRLRFLATAWHGREYLSCWSRPRSAQFDCRPLADWLRGNR